MISDQWLFTRAQCPNGLDFYYLQNFSSEIKALPNRPLAGGLLMLGSTLTFAGVGALAKLAMAYLDTETVVFFRNFMALAIMMPWLLLRHRQSFFRTQRLGLHLVRSAAGLGAMYCIFFALNHLRLGEAVLLSFTSPLFIPLVAFWWLKEPVSSQTRWAIVVGFIGVALILKPGHGLLKPAALVGVMAGVLMALGQVGIRRLSSTEPAERTVFYFTFISTIISALPLAWTWQTVPTYLWLILLSIGFLAVVGQVMMTKGYGLAPAARMGPITYANVVFSTLMGWMFWNETLDTLTWIGAILICVAGIVTSYRRGAIVVAPGISHQSNLRTPTENPPTRGMGRSRK